MSERIECQACTPKSREKDGCGTCGGYGFLIHKGKCEHCGSEFWSRPGVFTSYVGKRYRSYDGTAFLVKEGFKHVCQNCPDYHKEKE